MVLIFFFFDKKEEESKTWDFTPKTPTFAWDRTSSTYTFVFINLISSNDDMTTRRRVDYLAGETMECQWAPTSEASVKLFLVSFLLFSIRPASLCITYRINKLDINKFSTTVNSYFARAHRESLHVFRFFRALNVSSSLFSSLFSSPCSRSSIVTWPSTLGT